MKNAEKFYLKNCIKKLRTKFHESRTSGMTSKMKNSEALEGEGEDGRRQNFKPKWQFLI